MSDLRGNEKFLFKRWKSHSSFFDKCSYFSAVTEPDYLIKKQCDEIKKGFFFLLFSILRDRQRQNAKRSSFYDRCILNSNFSYEIEANIQGVLKSAMSIKNADSDLASL